MNFNFKVGDMVEFRVDSPRRREGLRLELSRECVAGIFIAKGSDGAYHRVRTSELLRVNRPSDAVEAAKVAERKEHRLMERCAREKRVEDNLKDFKNYSDRYKVPLTAKGVPDRRFKPRFSAVEVLRRMRGARG